MARTPLQAGFSAELKTLARQIIAAQTREIALMTTQPGGKGAAGEMHSG